MPAQPEAKPTRQQRREYHGRRAHHIERRHDRFYAVLEIPAAARPRLGRRFVRSLETDSLTVAERRAPPIIAGWRRQIAEARGQEYEPQDDAAFFRRALRDAKTETEREAIKEVVWDRAYDIGVANIGDHETPQDVPEAGDFYARATTGIDFGDFLTEWQATRRVTAKTRDMQAADVKRFAAKFPTIDDVTKPAVKGWVSGLMAEEKLTGKTVQRILSALRGYWRHLQSTGHAPEGVEPFTGLNVSTSGGRVRRDDKRQAFTRADVVKLLAEARERDDGELADLIDMARWTGARIEELCVLKVENVKLRHKHPHFTVNAGKTDAAIRDVPIHANLKPVLRRLIGERTRGYVLSDLTENKYGDRSNAIGKRFGYLKTALGFGEQFVFHSIRKTVATIFKDAGVPEATAADILGHDIATMSYGVYAGDVSLATKAEAIAKLRYPAR